MEFTGIVLIVCSLVLMLYFLLKKEDTGDKGNQPDDTEKEDRT